jgi:hypothetical protein
LATTKKLARIATVSAKEPQQETACEFIFRDRGKKTKTSCAISSVQPFLSFVVMGTCFTRQAVTVDENNKCGDGGGTLEARKEHVSRLEHLYRILSEANRGAYLSENECVRLRSVTEPVKQSAESKQVRLISYTMPLSHMFPAMSNLHVRQNASEDAYARFGFRNNCYASRTTDDHIHIYCHSSKDAPVTRAQALEIFRPIRSALERDAHLQGKANLPVRPYLCNDFVSAISQVCDALVVLSLAQTFHRWNFSRQSMWRECDFGPCMWM